MEALQFRELGGIGLLYASEKLSETPGLSALAGSRYRGHQTAVLFQLYLEMPSTTAFASLKLEMPGNEIESSLCDEGALPFSQISLAKHALARPYPPSPILP